MTLYDLITADVSAVILNTDDFAESVTQIRSDGTNTTITAIPHYEEPKVVVRDGGSKTVHSAQLDVPDSATLDLSDRWTFGGHTWECVAIGDSDAGLVPVMVERREREYESMDEDIVI